jgi:predicted amidophosphoribosyltransferase
MSRNQLAATWSRWLGSFLPRSCLLCESACGAAALCSACAVFLPGSRRPRCRTCARPWQVSRLCATCRALRPAFDATFAAADYVAPLDRAVTSLKFSGRIGLASGLGGLLADRWRDPGLRELLALDCLVPIPLAPGRQAERGFNQAHLIAASMLARLRAQRPAPPPAPPAPPAPLQATLPALRPALLARHQDTRPQSLLQRDARQANLDRGFIAAGRLDGLRIGVVDDVMTTGATLQAAAIALKAAGARRVVNLVVARTA